MESYREFVYRVLFELYESPGQSIHTLLTKKGFLPRKLDFEKVIDSFIKQGIVVKINKKLYLSSQTIGAIPILKDIELVILEGEMKE